MFGFTDYEMDIYRDLAQDFAVNEVAPNVIKQATFIVPAYIIDNQKAIDRTHLGQMTNDIEKIITFTASHMAYEYANMQCELDWEETEIIKHLHHKYEDYLVIQFIKYGLGFTLDILTEIIGGIILELPYLYVSVMEDDDFDDEQFMEEKLGAYNEYMKNYMQEAPEEPEPGDEELDNF